MKCWFLSQYFTKIAAKRLSQVEVNLVKSHQHELNGVSELKNIFWSEKVTHDPTFLYIDDESDEALSVKWKVTWYDSRENKPSRSPEFRLYFYDNEVMSCASEGDLLIVGLKSDGQILIIIAEDWSTIVNQLQWLFWIEKSLSLSVRSELETEQDRIWFVSRIVLEAIGIEVLVDDETYLEKMLEKFGTVFPTTQIFSAYAREVLWESINDLPSDDFLMACLDKEEILFRTLEKYFLAERLSQGFMTWKTPDVESFINFSLGVQNRRKSRAWAGFENHLEYLFKKENIKFDRTKITENKSKPDFLFPWVINYNSPSFPDDKLVMLGAKTSCKDRWRQVLTEANRIPVKHLITLQAGISVAQTDEMRREKVRLILPKQFHETYTEEQQPWLMNVSWFIDFVRERQV